MRNEQKKALEILEETVKNNDGVLYNDPSKFPMESNGIYKTNLNILPGELSSGLGWQWTQSGSRCKATIEIAKKNYNITFFKVYSRARRKGSDTTPPFCKAWIFDIETEGNDAQHFCWCEKIEAILDASLLKSLSFLSPFVSESSAIEFGWRN